MRPLIRSMEISCADRLLTIHGRAPTADSRAAACRPASGLPSLGRRSAAEASSSVDLGGTWPDEPRRIYGQGLRSTRYADPKLEAALKTALSRLGCPNGLIFDAEVCVILRDTFASLEASSLEEDGRIRTDRVLARVPRGLPLDQRVLDWLRAMAGSWSDELPVEQDDAAPFITDIVPAVSGSSIRQVA